MTEVFILAIALSMDAFAVSIGLGSKQTRKTGSLAINAAIYFGAFQALMPAIGFFSGKGVLGWIDGYAHWVAFFLLLAIGLKMIYEAISEGIEENIAKITHKILFALAIATSIDAMAAGFSLNVLSVAPLLSCGIIGITTFIFSLAGVLIGSRSGTWLENKAELLGGSVLILIGLKILLF